MKRYFMTKNSFVAEVTFNLFAQNNLFMEYINLLDESNYVFF